MMTFTTFRDALDLAQRDFLEEVWPAGRNPCIDWDGSHFALRGHPDRPISVSAVEACVLANLVCLLDCSSVFEIGTGFGYSTTWLAYGLSMCSHPVTVHTLDDDTQGNLAGLGLEVAAQLWTRAGLAHLVTPHLGHSPPAIAALQLEPLSLVFVDGEHYHDQPIADYRAVEPLLGPEACLVFHDAQAKYDVSHALAQAEADGFTCLPLNTSCEMVVASRSPHALAAARDALGLARRRLAVTS